MATTANGPQNNDAKIIAHFLTSYDYAAVLKSGISSPTRKATEVCAAPLPGICRPISAAYGLDVGVSKMSAQAL